MSNKDKLKQSNNCLSNVVSNDVNASPIEFSNAKLKRSTIIEKEIINDQPMEKTQPTKKVFIVGDSMINGVNPNRFGACKNVNVSKTIWWVNIARYAGLHQTHN